VPRLGPLRHRAYRLVWIGRATSSVGDRLIFIAFAFAVLHVGGGASDLGLILGAGTLVRVILLLAGGVWADRLPRQLVMLTADATRGAVELALAILLIAGHATLWQLTLGYLAHSAAESFFGPASDGLVPQLVPKSELQQANALLELTQNAPAIFGPVLSGLLISLFGLGWVFVVDAATFAVSGICLALVRLPPREPREREGFVEELLAGWQAVRSRSWYWQNLITHAVWNFAFPFFQVLGPVVAVQHLGGAKSWGFVSGASGLGYVLGSAVVLRWKPRRPLVVGNLGLVLAGLPLVLLAKPTGTWPIAAALCLSSFGLAVLNTLWWSVVQARIPEDVLSRVSSWDWLISLVINPLGLALAGPVAAAVGTRTALLVAAGLVSIPSVVISFVPSVRGIEREPEAEPVAAPTPG
jgi:MFS family permease